jgi:hypothetical protein
MGRRLDRVNDYSGEVSDLDGWYGRKWRPQNRERVNFYAPQLSPDEIASIRSAFSATEDQLIYLPLQTG